MTRRFATFASRMAIAMTMMLGIAACGGGGGGGGGFQSGPGGGDGDDGDIFFIQASLKDANGEETSVVSSSAPANLEVLVTRNGRGGPPAADIIVLASTDLGALFPESGSALTDAQGIASFRVEAGGDKGASSIVISVNNEDGSPPTTETVNFQVGETGLRIGFFDNGTFVDGLIGISPEGPISSEGQAILSLAIVEQNGQPVQGAENLRINSPCLNDGRATIDPANPVEVTTGQVTVTYVSSGCEGADIITAELVGTSATAVSDIEVASPSANGLTFVSAEPNLIVLRGTGGGPDRVEKSEVRFQAVNAENRPLRDVRVSFDLTTEVGGVSLSPSSAVSDGEGFVSTIVSSGDVATVVRVIATTESGNGGNDVSAVSDVLTVSTGLPDQNSISVSVAESFVAPEGMTVDGVEREITVRMADKFNNPVPDGTAAIFTTEYGSIEPSCETVNGACAVTWTSQAPRFPTLTSNQELVKTILNDPDYDCPSHNGLRGPCPDDLGFIRGGRSTVLVTAIGEESFIDRNGNGLFDREEASDGLWTNLTEAFLDQNENGLYDPATEACNPNSTPLECRAGSEETFSDFNNNGAFDANGDDISNGYPDEGVIARYNGLLCPLEGDGVWCSRELVNVRDSTIVILSTDPNWDIAFYDDRTPVNTVNAGRSYVVYVSDLFNNKPPAGATLTLSASGACSFEGETSFQVPNTTSTGAIGLSFAPSGAVEYDSCTDPLPDREGRVTLTLSAGTGSPDYFESVACLARVIDTGATPCPPPGP